MVCGLRKHIGGKHLIDRHIWVGALFQPSSESRKKIVLSALENGFDTVVLDERDKSFTDLGRFRAITLRSGTFLEEGDPVGSLVELKSKADEIRAKKLAEKGTTVVVSANNWKVIPLENLIVFQGSGSRLMMLAKSADEARLFFETIERGADGVLFVPSKLDELAKLRKLMEERSPRLDMKEAKITSPGNHGMWCGELLASCGPEDPPEGYANLYDDNLD